ncbi:MAG: hypothetical protein M5R42_09550 [Rhodocyclaceae bacterium]|nr:hypothetical protein [Rhodocyclaceae bacterium]
MKQKFMHQLGPDVHVLQSRQPTMPVLAAISLMGRRVTTQCSRAA